MGDNQKICLRPYIPEARYVFIKQGKSGRKSIINTNKLHHLSLPLTNVQTLRIRELDTNPYLSDDKIEYISLNKPIKIGVLAA